jgi:hypothetical protein
MSLRRVHSQRTVGAGHPALRFLIALTVALVGLVATAGPASAHHPEITGSVDCTGKVTFTVRAWSGPDAPSRTNPDVRVHRSTDGGRTYTTPVGSGAFTTANGYSFSGSTTTTGTEPVRLRVQAYANWGSGAAPGEPRYVTLNPPTNCAVSAPTAGAITHNCTSWSAVLDNTASNVAVTYVVTVNGAAQQVSVPAHTALPYSGPIGEDTTNTVTLSANGTVLGTATFTVNCVPPPQQPEVLGDSASGKVLGSLRVSCQGTVRVTMRNRSSQRAHYTVRIAKRKHHMSVRSGKTRTWVTSAKPRQRAQLWHDGRLLASKRLPRACVAPVVLPDTGQRR